MISKLNRNYRRVKTCRCCNHNAFVPYGMNGVKLICKLDGQEVDPECGCDEVE